MIIASVFIILAKRTPIYIINLYEVSKIIEYYKKYARINNDNADLIIKVRRKVLAEYYDYLDIFNKINSDILL
jgi:hypothetical protein